MAYLRQFLTLVKNSGITLKLKICSFLAKKGDYLLHVICPSLLEIAKTTTSAIKVLKNQTSETEVRSILSLCNVFRPFVPSFCDVAARLSKTSVSTSCFNSKRFRKPKKAVERLKYMLANPPVLTLPRAGGHSTISSDTCNTQLQYVLLQNQQDGAMKPAEYWSRTLAEPKYLATTHKE